MIESVNDIESVSTPDAPAPAGHYVQALVHNGIIYVSGQLPGRPDGTSLAGAPFVDQARQAIENLLAIVRAAGGCSERVLQVTAYVAGVAYWPLFDRVFAEAFGSTRPARVVVPVPELHHGYLIELEARAART